MKKIISLLLAVIVTLGLLAGCSAQDPNSDQKTANSKTTVDIESNKPTTENDTPKDDNADVDTTPTEPEREKLTEQVYRASNFSEGLAVVVAGGKNGRGCVINKKGEIVFDLDFEIENSYVVSGTEFINGYAFINDGILDKNGKMTYPEDVGATKFYAVALAGGYIVAEVVEADYSSTKKMLGVMNTKFEWVVQPTEALYTAMSNEHGSLGLNTAVNTGDRLNQRFVYVANIEKLLNVETGEVVDYKDMDFDFPSTTWQPYTDGTFRDYEDNVRVDLSEYENVNVWTGNGFKDGTALIVFTNQQAKTTYFTAIDEKGNFLFEPVDFKQFAITSIETDGNTILVTYSKSAEELIMKTYDMQGKQISEFNTKSIGKYCSYSASIGDGVVMVEGGYNYSHYAWYYTTALEPLF